MKTQKLPYSVEYGRIMFRHKNNCEFMLSRIDSDEKAAAYNNALAVEHDLNALFEDMAAKIRNAPVITVFDVLLWVSLGVAATGAAAMYLLSTVC